MTQPTIRRNGSTLPPAPPSQADALAAEVRRLQAENDALRAKARTARPFALKVSEKGGLSVYGLGRFPVTLYAGQWDTLLSHVDDIRAFLTKHAEEFSVKGE